jgi:hypothetical protein
MLGAAYFDFHLDARAQPVNDRHEKDNREVGSAEFVPAELRELFLQWTRHNGRRLRDQRSLPADRGLVWAAVSLPV